jgi:5-methylcytosine-specific restriction protein B
MNSVDRSIALLDIALRRRFRFQRINPNPDLVVDEIDGVNVRSIYLGLNDRLAVLLGEDYQLGHSYLMADKVKDGESLKAVWFENIIPLLQEYFFDDWDKLKALVPPFIESVDVRGLDNLGLLSVTRHRFSQTSIDTDTFIERLKELGSFLQGK